MDPNSTKVHPYQAAYYGLAAIAMAGIFLIMALPAFQMSFWLEVNGYKGWSETDKKLAAYGGYIGAGAIVLLSLIGAGIGMLGGVSAMRTGESKILSGVGTILSLMSAAIWFLCGVAWHSTAYRFIRGD